MLRVYVDETVFLACSREQDSGSCHPFLNLIKAGKIEAWISSSTKLDLLRHGLNNTLVNDLTKDCSEVPLRRAITAKTLTGTGNCETQLHVHSARQFGINHLATIDKSRYIEVADLTAFDPCDEKVVAALVAGTTIISVPFLDLKAQHNTIYNEIDDHITDIICNTAFIQGKYVQEFEREFASAHGAKYCAAMSTGTDALHVAMLCLGVGPGDEVIVPTNTFIATAEGVSLVGAKPVFVDCDQFFNMNIAGLEQILSTKCSKPGHRVKAIIPVHLYGQPAAMDEINALAHTYGIPVVEDACQSHLAQYKGKHIGNFGVMAAFSFYPGKNIGAYGEAGALLTNDETLYQTASKIRQHGESVRYHHAVVGHNYRMEAIQGAVLATKMKHAVKWTTGRRKNAQLYKEFLSGISQIEIPLELPGTEPVYHLYVIQADHRDDLKAFLESRNIGTGLHYPLPLHLQPAYSGLNYKKGDFPIAERAAERILSLPMYPELEKPAIKFVCDAIRAFYSSAKKRS